MTPSSATGLEAVKDELLPCPFCGARLQRQETTSGHWHEHMGEVEDCYATGSIVFDQNIAAWNRRASPTPPTAPAVPAGVREALIEKFCGDKVNGGMLRDMAYTVWHACHHPAHEDGNTDWGNDTLPIVNKAVEALREALSALPAQPNGSERQKALDAAAALVDGWTTAANTRHLQGWGVHTNAVADMLAKRDAEIATAIRALATNPEPKL